MNFVNILAAIIIFILYLSFIHPLIKEYIPNMLLVLFIIFLIRFVINKYIDGLDEGKYY